VRPIDRLQSLGQEVSAFLPSPALIWKDLVNWVGALVPATPKSLPLLKRRLLVVCVESGLGLDQTIIQVAQELRGPHPELCSEFALMNLEMRAGQRRVDVLHNLADRWAVWKM
jgi:hypothetical protein